MQILGIVGVPLIVPPEHKLSDTVSSMHFLPEFISNLLHEDTFPTVSVFNTYTDPVYPSYFDKLAAKFIDSNRLICVLIIVGPFLAGGKENEKQEEERNVFIFIGFINYKFLI